MVLASLRSLRPGFARNLLAGGLLIACLGLLGLAEAAPGEKTGEKTGEPKAPAGKAPAPLPPLRLTIVADGSDVGEMSKVINDKLEAAWKANNIAPSGYVDDYEFIRRASLDIVGRVAKPDEIVAYMKDPVEKRRSLLIERLLKHEDYARHWANLWSNWLLTRNPPFGRGKYHDQTTVWLEDQFAQNKPYNEMVTKLLTATGKNSENGAVNFMLAHLGERVPNSKVREEGQFEVVPLTSRITRVFLATQVQCAQCHPHPFFGSLKQEQFWGINAFLRQIRREGTPPMEGQRMMTMADLTLADDTSVNTDANVFFEMRNGKVRMWHAEFLPPAGKDRGAKLDPKSVGVARREELARYLVDHEMFSKAIVNRMWGLFLGRGFVNPVDDFNDNNQPSNPELLDELAARFKHYNYDLKKLIRWIAHSKAYHLSYVANKTNDKPEHEPQFARMVMKSLSPEQLFESLMTATHADKSNTPAEKKRMRDEWLDRLISQFGDDEGNEVNFNGTIVQALLMMNGKNINDAITAKSGTVAEARLRKKTPQGVIEYLYLAALNRPPKPSETRNILTKIALRRGFRDSEQAMYEDLFWALLNSNEFLLNH